MEKVKIGYPKPNPKLAAFEGKIFRTTLYDWCERIKKLEVCAIQKDGKSHPSLILKEIQFGVGEQSDEIRLVLAPNISQGESKVECSLQFQSPLRKEGVLESTNLDPKKLQSRFNKGLERLKSVL